MCFFKSLTNSSKYFDARFCNFVTYPSLKVISLFVIPLTSFTVLLNGVYISFVKHTHNDCIVFPYCISSFNSFGIGV